MAQNTVTTKSVSAVKLGIPESMENHNMAVPIACNSRKPEMTDYATPDNAANALVAAAKAGDLNALLAIFGPESRDLLNSGAPVQDKSNVSAFVERYDVMHRWSRMTDGSQILIVDADNFPFPIPLKKNKNGRWFFDTAAVQGGGPQPACGTE